MPRYGWLLVCLLALATGLALLAAGETVIAPVPRAERGGDAADEALVRGFYAAINEVLGTGDPAALDAIVTPDFVDHGDGFDGAADREGLERSLADLRAAFPAMRLTVDGLVADGDRVAVRVTANNLRPSSKLAGLLPDPSPVRHTVDLLRLARGQVAERWDQGPPLSFVQTLWEAPLSPIPPGPLALGLARLVLAQGAAIPETAVRGPVVMHVEVGTLTVQVDGPATITVGPDRRSTPRAIDEGIAQPVRVGEVLAITAGTRYAAWNAGAAPTGVLAAAIVPTPGGTDERPFGVPLVPSDAAIVTGPPDASTGPVTPVATPVSRSIVWPPGVDGRYLVCLRLPALPAEGLAMTVGQVTLGPGASFRPLAVDGTAVLAVESGSLVLTVGRGRVQLVQGAGEEAAVADALATGENPLSASDAAMVLPRTVAFARNGGDAPLAVVLVTITQVVA